jgi:hypothetical protein
MDMNPEEIDLMTAEVVTVIHIFLALFKLDKTYGNTRRK